jgi:hypothetical protein
MNRFLTLMGCEECLKTKPNVVACGLIFEQPTTGNQDNSVRGGKGMQFLFSVTPLVLFSALAPVQCTETTFALLFSR